MPDTKFPDGSTVAQRIGLVCWWLGCGAGIASVAATVIAVVGGVWGEELIGYLPLGLVFGLLSWLCGRGLLFIMASR